MRKNNMGRPKPKMKSKPSAILKRLFSYIFKNYKIHCISVVILILISSLTNIMGTMFMKNLIDDYITPFLKDGNPDFSPLLKALIIMGSMYYFGALCTWGFNRIMVSVTQGTLKNLRNDLFKHMEKLPIKYYDTHAHGDIMSIYTNDTDTLRQMISQGIPQFISSGITVFGVLISMIILNIPLTLLTLVMVSIMLFVTKKIAKQSGTYFVKQQKSLGKVNGYIEEMMEGQKGIKVFCHEEESINEFNKINEDLCECANNANKYANKLMPVMANIGNISYVITAICGALLAIYNVGNFSLGGLASFLQFNRTLNQPIAQLSQQLKGIVMALAGAE